MTTPSVKPVAGDDHYSFFEDQAIGGNVLANDVAGSNGALYLRSFENSDVLAKVANQVTDIVGQYGTFHMKANGDWTYTLSDAAKVNFFAGMTLHESVQYKISDGAGHTDAGIFTLDIQGVTTKPIAVDDTYTFGENDAIGGNVLSNDTPGETGQLILRSVTGTNIAANPAQTTDVSGTYGTFHFHPDGSFTYDLDPTVKAGLNDGQSLTETLQYQVDDGQGHAAPGTINLTINGATDPGVHPTDVVMTFEDVGSGNPVPAGYHGFTLAAAGNSPYGVLALNENQGDAFTGLPAVSQENKGNGYVGFLTQENVPMTMVRTDHSTFDFNGGYFAGASIDYEQITISGWKDGTEMYSQTLTLNALTATHMTVDWHDIDEVRIDDTQSGRGHEIVFDDLEFHV